MRPPTLPPQNPYTACSPEGTKEGPGAPLAVEVRDEFGPFGADQTVVVSDTAGWPLVTFGCNGPIDVFRLNPGAYRVMAFVGKLRSEEVTVTLPSGGTSVTLMLKPPEPHPSGE